MADLRRYSNLYGSPTLLPNPNLPHADMYAALEAGYANAASYTAAVLQVQASSPCVLAFLSEEDHSIITIAHGPRLYRGSPGEVHTAIGKVVVLIGDDPASMTNMVLSERAFVGTGNIPVTDDVAAHKTALEVSTTAGLPFVENAAVGVGVTNQRARKIVVLPCAWAARAVGLASAYLTTTEFYDTFLLPVVADASYDHIVNWWKAATTCGPAVGGVNPVQVSFVNNVDQTPAMLQVIRGWTNRHSVTDLAGLGGGAAGLAQVTTAIGVVSTQLANTEAQREAEATAAAITSYGGRFGVGTSDLVQRFTRVGSERDLPEVHQIFASYKERSRDTNTINLALYAASQDLAQINETNLPKCTPYLLNLFRSHELIGNSIELGDGANPFSVVCQGHHNTKDVLVLADKLTTVESGGAAISMSDASLFKTKDGRFPQSYLQAVDKLWAFVLVIDVYSGHDSDIAVSLRRGLRDIGPMILQLESLFHSNPRLGLMVAIRIMLYFQRITGLYYRKARSTPSGDLVLAPDFDKLSDDLRMQAYDALPRVPDTWMEVLKGQVPEIFAEAEVPRIRGGGGGATATSGTSTSAARSSVVNPRPSNPLVKRWVSAKASNDGFDRLADLRTKWNGAGTFQFPKDPSTNSDICLKYQLEKKCDSSCPRKATHKSYGTDVVTTFHGFLDSCQVARSE